MLRVTVALVVTDDVHIVLWVEKMWCTAVGRLGYGVTTVAGYGHGFRGAVGYGAACNIGCTE